MILQDFHARILQLKGATYQVKFSNKRTYCVGNRMFARAGALGESHPLYGFKATDITFEILVGEGAARPMPYLHRAKWVQLIRPDILSDDELMSYVSTAYELIASKLTRRQRQELGSEISPPPSLSTRCADEF